MNLKPKEEWMRLLKIGDFNKENVNFWKQNKHLNKLFSM